MVAASFQCTVGIVQGGRQVSDAKQFFILIHVVIYSVVAKKNGLLAEIEIETAQGRCEEPYAVFGTACCALSSDCQLNIHLVIAIFFRPVNFTSSHCLAVTLYNTLVQHTV